LSRAGAALLLGRLVAGAVALGCGALAFALAVQHPVLGALAALPLAMALAAGAWAQGAWPLWLLPLLPLVGGMPWTGWLVVEELDLLVLAGATGGYGRWAFDRRRLAAPRWTAGTLVGAFLLLAYAASLVVSAQRGVADAGGWAWGWWQAYHEPLNALRVGKPLFLAMLVLPLWLRAHTSDPQRASRDLLLGMAGLLGAVALAVVWERLAHTDLLNFSSDYRTTALFWEMHVGGAALDAALVLALPFAVVALARTHEPWRWAALASALVLGAYACLVTFSRVVYVAVPIALAVLMALRAWQQAGDDPAPAESAPAAGGWATAALLAAFGAAAFVVFGGSGYRGLLALLGIFALALPLATLRPAAQRGVVTAGVVGGLLLAALSWAAFMLVPKGAYLAYAAVALGGGAAVAMIEFARRRQRVPSDLMSALLLACTLASCAGLVWVALHWRGEAALPATGGVALLLAAAALGLALARRAPWSASLRWQASRLGLLGVLGLVVAVFGGGAYMGGRWAAVEDDLGGRLTKWRDALSLRTGPQDEWLGRGLGRYAATQFMSGAREDQTGDHRFLDDTEGRRLLLTSGKHILGWGQLYRISQRVESPGAAARVRVRVRTDDAVALHGEVCEKHLLYNGTCLTGQVGVKKPVAGGWQTVEWALEGGAAPSRGAWYAPSFITFSLALDSRGSRAEFAGVELFGADGRQLLANTDFERGGARWFFSSDHHHMPWHAKHLGVHLLFEQGLVGAALFGALVFVALARSTLGGLRRHPLGPPLAGAIVGVLVVGQADSLLDIPRVGFLIYLVLGVALLLRGEAGSSETRTPSRATAALPDRSRSAYV
jgi:hypothetical protein